MVRTGFHHGFLSTMLNYITHRYQSLIKINQKRDLRNTSSLGRIPPKVAPVVLFGQVDVQKSRVASMGGTLYSRSLVFKRDRPCKVHCDPIIQQGSLQSIWLHKAIFEAQVHSSNQLGVVQGLGEPIRFSDCLSLYLIACATFQSRVALGQEPLYAIKEKVGQKSFRYVRKDA